MNDTIILMRHAERLDRSLEAKGEDWITTAPRPQDPPLSAAGREQAQRVAHQLIANGHTIDQILCSPLVRCVETADIIATELGMPEEAQCLCVEPGLIEQSRSMRGTAPPEPPPVWPIYLSPSQLQSHSSRINMTYTPLLQVKHTKNEAYLNHVQELPLSISPSLLLPSLSNPNNNTDIDDKKVNNLHHNDGTIVSISEQDAVTYTRCHRFTHSLLQRLKEMRTKKKDENEDEDEEEEDDEEDKEGRKQKKQRRGEGEGGGASLPVPTSSSSTSSSCCVLCVGHGASVHACATALQEGLPCSSSSGDPKNLRVQGERQVSCFAAFTPFLPAHLSSCSEGPHVTSVSDTSSRHATATVATPPVECGVMETQLTTS